LHDGEGLCARQLERLDARPRAAATFAPVIAGVEAKSRGSALQEKLLNEEISG